MKTNAAWAAAALLYLASGKLGLSLASVNASATPVWPPTGVALASFLLLGRGGWPAIFAAAFLVNWTTAGGIASSSAIAAGNTLEGLAAAWLVERFAGGRRAFARPAGVFLFCLLGGVVAPVISATVGLTTLLAFGMARPPDAEAVWSTWWLGDMAGALVFAPALVLWGEPARRQAPWEMAALGASAAVLGAASFHGANPIGPNAPIAFLNTAPVLWAAFRFGRREAAVMACFTAVLALTGTLRGLGPFALMGPNAGLLIAQGFMAFTTVSSLAVAAVVAHLHETELELRAAHSRLESRLDMVSHELRTPISAILGYAETLRRGGLDDQANRYDFVSTIERHSRRLARLVDDLLAAPRIEAGRLQPAASAVDLAELLEGVAGDLAPAAELKAAQLKVSVPRGLLVRADPEHLRQVFHNLLDNALKFGDAGVSVEAGGSAGEEGVVNAWVRDTGPGIPESFAPKLFGRFQRAEETKQVPGTGLGLYIVKRLLEANGGTIRREPAKPGTLFALTLLRA